MFESVVGYGFVDSEDAEKRNEGAYAYQLRESNEKNRVPRSDHCDNVAKN